MFPSSGAGGALRGDESPRSGPYASQQAATPLVAPSPFAEAASPDPAVLRAFHLSPSLAASPASAAAAAAVADSQYAAFFSAAKPAVRDDDDDDDDGGLSSDDMSAHDDGPGDDAARPSQTTSAAIATTTTMAKAPPPPPPPLLPKPPKPKKDKDPVLQLNHEPSFELAPTMFYRGFQAMAWARNDWLSAQHVCDLIDMAKAMNLRCAQPTRPPSGSLFYFDVRCQVAYRRDGYEWIKKKGSTSAVREDHVKLQLGNEPRVYASYVHSSEFADPASKAPHFHRRSYWIIDSSPLDRGILVHYLMEKHKAPAVAHEASCACSTCQAQRTAPMPQMEHAGDCACLACLVTRRNEQLGQPFAQFWDVEQRKEEAEKKANKEAQERARALQGDKRDKKKPVRRPPTAAAPAAWQDRRKRDSKGEIVPVLDGRSDAFVDAFDSPRDNHGDNHGGDDGWGAELSQKEFMALGDDLEHELLYGNDGTDLFSLDLTPQPPRFELACFAPRAVLKGDDVVACLASPQPVSAAVWAGLDVAVVFGTVVVDVVTRPIAGALHFVAPADGPFRVRVAGVFVDQRMADDAARPNKRTRPSVSPERAAASAGEVPASPEDEMGEDELDRHASVMVERAVRVMISGGASEGLKDVINEVSDNNGFNFLHTVIYCGARAEIAAMLLDKGADVNAATASGDSPLHLAAEVGDSALARLLVRHGADLDAVDARSCTPLQLAVNLGHSSPDLFAALAGDKPGRMATPLPTPGASPARDVTRSPRTYASPGSAGAGGERTREEHMNLLKDALASLSLHDQYALTMAVSERGRSNSVAALSGQPLLPGPPLLHPRSASVGEYAAALASAPPSQTPPLLAEWARPGVSDDVAEAVEENQAGVISAMMDENDAPARASLDHEASIIQSNVRAWILRKQFLHVREATRKVQAVTKGHLARRQVRELRERASATLVIQKSLREFIQRRRQEAPQPVFDADMRD